MIYIVGTLHPDDLMPQVSAYAKKEVAEYQFLKIVKNFNDEIFSEKDLLHPSVEDRVALDNGVYMSTDSGALVWISDVKVEE